MWRLQPAVIRRWIALLVAAPALAVAACPSNAPVTLAAAPRPLESCDLPPDSVRHVIVLDRSGSMRPVWPTVRRQLAAIIESVPDGSWVRVEGFADHVVTLVHDVRLTGENRATAVQQALRIAEPLPRAPTDLGRAMETALDDVLLARERGRGRVTLLFFITDGKHDPAAGSPYTGAATFDWLSAQWVRRMHDATIHPFVFAIPIGSGLEGADLVQRTIPGARAEPPRPPEAIGEVVTDIMLRIAKDVRRALVEADLEHAQERLSARVRGEPRVRWLADADADVVLRSSATCVTYAVSDAVIGGNADPSYEGSGRHGVLVPPGDSAVLRVALRGAHPAAHWLPVGRAVSDTFDAYAGSPLALAAVLGFEPRHEIGGLVSDAPASGAVGIRVGGTLRREAISWPKFVLIAASVLLALVLAWYALLPARPAPLRPTKTLDRDRRRLRVETLARSTGGARLLRSLPDGTNVRLRYRRASRLRSPRRVRLEVEADRADAVAVASERRDGSHDVIPLPAHAPHPLDRKSYIVWAGNGENLPHQLAPGAVEDLPGYYWSGRS